MRGDRANAVVGAGAGRARDRGRMTRMLARELNDTMVTEKMLGLAEFDVE